MNETDYYDGYGTGICDMDNASIMGSNFRPTLFSVVFVVGFVGNSVVLWILLMSMKLKTISDICLLNLAVSDLMVALSMPIWAYHSAGYKIMSHLICKIMTFAYQTGFYSGIFFVTLMGIERYLAIVHAVAALRVRTVRNGTVASIAIWITSLLCALPEVIFSDMLKDYDKQICIPEYPTAFTWKLFRNFRENIVGLFISLPIMMYCYIRILCVLMRSRNSKKHKAMRLILTIALLFAVFWLPYNVVVLLTSLMEFNIGNNCENSQKISLATEVTETLVLVHCCVNPIIYAFVGEKFRKSLNNMLSRFPLCGYLFKHQPIPIKSSEIETSNTSV